MDCAQSMIQILFIPNSVKSWKFKIELFIAKKILNCKVSTIITIPAKYFQNEYYTELFTIINNDETLNYTFQFKIYKGIINHIYIDMNQNVMNFPSFEVIFFGLKYLPQKISYKNNDLKISDNNNNKYRKRFCIVNADPKQLEFLHEGAFEKYIFDSRMTYEIAIRFSEKNDYKCSCSLIKDAKLMNNSNDKKLLLSREEIQLLEEFNSNYLMLLENLSEIKDSKDTDLYKNTIEVASTSLQDLKNDFDIISKKNFYEYMSEPLKYLFDKDLLQFIHYYYFVSQFNSIYSRNNDIENFYGLLNSINRANQLEMEFYERIKYDINLKEDEKINLLITLSTIFIKLIISNNNINDVDYINIQNINQVNPYSQSINLITDIINNINEDSRLFEAFLYFNSGSIENYLEKNKEKTYYINNAFDEEVECKLEKYKTEYDISLLNVEQIKSHLKNLRPKLIIRIGVKGTFRAYYDQNTNIMVINEEEVLKQEISILNADFQDQEISKIYTIPITMEIFHEMMAHAKIRFLNKEEKSPRFFRDSRDNFKYKEILKSCKAENKIDRVPIPVPESGRVLEKFISENERIISDLKTPKKENIIFINYKYWIGPDFRELEDYILNNIQNNGNNSINDDKSNYDYYYNNDFDGCYIDRSYMKIK